MKTLQARRCWYCDRPIRRTDLYCCGPCERQALRLQAVLGHLGKPFDQQATLSLRERIMREKGIAAQAAALATV